MNLCWEYTVKMKCVILEHLCHQTELKRNVFQNGFLKLVLYTFLYLIYICRLGWNNSELFKAHILYIPYSTSCRVWPVNLNENLWIKGRFLMHNRGLLLAVQTDILTPLVEPPLLCLAALTNTEIFWKQHWDTVFTEKFIWLNYSCMC